MPREKVHEYADLLGVKVFRPGSHNGREFSPDDMDIIAKNSNESLEYLLESAQTGEYEGNPTINLEGKDIPQLINLNHQEDLKDTIKNASKQISGKFYTKVLNGVKWVLADLQNVPNDIAEFLKRKYPLRSVELMPTFYNPKIQKIVNTAIRSIGFLDPSMPPAVKGQSNDFVVQFGENNRIITVYLDVDAQTTGEDREDTNIEENSIMAVDKDMKKAPEQEAPAVSVAEFGEMKAKIKEMQDALAQEKEAKQRLSLELANERKTRENREIEIFCENLAIKYNASQAYVDMLKSILEKADGHIILEFGEEKKSLRVAIEEFAVDILKNAKNLIVPMGEEAPGLGAKQQPAQSKQTKQMATIDEFKRQIRESGLSDEREIFLKAYELAKSSNPGLFEEG